MSEQTQITAEPGQPTFTMTRVYDAPRELIFEASTNPEYLRRWWGPRSLTMPVCEIDLRPGGSYRFVHRDADGNEYPFKGEYLEVAPPEKLVHTQIFDMEPFRDRAAVVTVTLEDLGGKTKLTSTVAHDSVEDRDGHLNAGREGMLETMDRLGELLEEMKAAAR